MTLLSDTPFPHDQEDPLRFDRVAKGIARTILASKDSTPVTLGVEGSWGVGKSTLMTKIKGQVEDQDSENVETLWYNVWTHSGRFDVLEGLIKNILEKIGSGPIRRTLRSTSVRSTIGFLFSAVMVMLRLSSAVDVFWEELAGDPSAKARAKELMNEVLKKWGQGSDGFRKKLVVIFIDDLDRCKADVVIQFLEAIRVYLDVPGLVFVLGYDRQALQAAVSNYLGIDQAQAQVFLEKMVHVSYAIPQPSERQGYKLLEYYLESVSLENEIRKKEDRALLLRFTEYNPRKVKRVLNMMALDRALSGSTLRDSGLVPTFILRTSYPSFTEGLCGTFEAGVIKDFLAYCNVRGRIQRGHALDDPEISKYLKEKGIDAASNQRDPLVILDREVYSFYKYHIDEQGLIGILQHIEASGRAESIEEDVRDLGVAERRDRPPLPPNLEGSDTPASSSYVVEASRTTEDPLTVIPMQDMMNDQKDIRPAQRLDESLKKGEFEFLSPTSDSEGDEK